MATDIATLGIKVDSSDVKNADNDLEKLANTGKKAEGSARGLGSSFALLGGLIATLGVSTLIAEYGRLSDTYKNVNGQLKLVTSGSQELSYVSGKLFDIAQRSRVGFEGVADVYASLARSTKALGASSTDLLQVTETINKSLIVSSASAASAEGALRQLGQGFASGTLRGDELNSILEGVPRLAQAIAEGMGKTVGQLRALGAEGKLTGEAVFNALKTQKDVIEREFAKMPVTIGQSFTLLSNEILKFIGESDQATQASSAYIGAAQLMAVAVKELARNFETIITVVSALGVALGVGFVTRAIQARLAMTAVSLSFASMGVAARGAGLAILGAFGGPVGLAITAVAVAVGFLTGTFAANKAAAENTNRVYKETQIRLQLLRDASGGAAAGNVSVGKTARAAAPGVEYLAGQAAVLGNKLYYAADGAKKARIEIAAMAMTQAKADEIDARRNLPAARADASKVRMGGFLAPQNWPIMAKSASDNIEEWWNPGSNQAKKDRYVQATKTEMATKELYDAALKSPNGGNEGVARGGGGSDDKKKGSKGKGGGGASEAEQAAKASKEYADSLKIETEEIGKNTIQQGMMRAEREAAKAPTEALKKSILDNAEAWKKAMLAQEASAAGYQDFARLAQEAVQANRAQMQAGADMVDQIELETRLRGMNAREREVAIALAEMERQGIVAGTEAYDKYAASILKAAEARGALQQRADDTRTAADEMRNVGNSVRDATDAFAELFGTTGRGFADLIDVIQNYREVQLDSEAKVAEARARYGSDSIEAKRAEIEAAQEMSRAEIGYYGDMIGAAKRMFKEKSAGWKILEAAEKAYRAYQMISAVIEMINTTKSIAMDGVKTASSVANSGTRAAADGVAAFAKTLASLPFPLNIAAGAAVLAALVAVGVKMAGGGGGKSKSATESAVKTEPAYSGPVDEYGAPTSSYSVLKPGAVRASNDNGASAPAPGLAAGGGAGMGASVTFGDMSITVQGGADADTVKQVQGLLEENRQRTIQEARQVVNQDMAERASRQRIGGS